MYLISSYARTIENLSIISSNSQNEIEGRKVDALLGFH